MKHATAVETKASGLIRTALRYIRPDNRSSELQQRAITDAFAATKGAVIRDYVEAEKRPPGAYPARAKLAKALRAGDVVLVSDFHRLASKTLELGSAVREIRARKLNTVIVEARTGRRSDCAADLADMMAEAAMIYAGAGRYWTPAEARAKGEVGGLKSPATKPKTGRAPWSVIKKEMRNPDHEHVYQVVAALNGMGYETDVNRVWIHREAVKRGTSIAVLRGKLKQ